MSGYMYRIATADATTLRETVQKVVGFPCWSFGGAALWDVDSRNERNNLRPITRIDMPENLSISGDFGHAFNQTAEVRWKRCKDAVYDLLILSDQQPNLANAQPMGNDRGEWITSTPTDPTRVAIIQSGGYSPLHFIAYHAPNGAVQVLRYKKLEANHE